MRLVSKSLCVWGPRKLDGNINCVMMMLPMTCVIVFLWQQAYIGMFDRTVLRKLDEYRYLLDLNKNGNSSHNQL